MIFVSCVFFECNLRAQGRTSQSAFGGIIQWRHSKRHHFPEEEKSDVCEDLFHQNSMPLSGQVKQNPVFSFAHVFPRHALRGILIRFLLGFPKLSTTKFCPAQFLHNTVPLSACGCSAGRAHCFQCMREMS